MQKRATRIACAKECNIYCTCRLPDSGGDCDEWFHFTCLNITNVSIVGVKWYCNDCKTKTRNMH